MGRSASTKTVIVGDIGGQFEVFKDIVASVGGDPATGVLPAGITMVQVGDVVRFAEAPALDSLACAELADRLIHANGGRYVQMLGNHESPLLGGTADPKWEVRDLPECRAIVQRWWDEGSARLAVALQKDDHRDMLITHAGLTRGYAEWLGADTAPEAVRALNAFVGKVGFAEFERPGALVTGDPDPGADPLWAMAASELHPSWLGAASDFDQIHGHSCLVDWESGEFWPEATAAVRRATTVDRRGRFTATLNGGSVVRSVDWVLQNGSRRMEWPLLVLSGYSLCLN